MTTVTEAPMAALRASFTALATQALGVLYQHRAMTTDQLHQLLTPAAKRPVYLRRELKRLLDAGLVDRLWAQYVEAAETPDIPAQAMSDRQRKQAPLNTPYLWFLTEAGAETVEQGGEAMPRPYRVTPESAAGSRQLHTRAVNDTGLAFVRHAARLGHECGPLDWMPEVAHRIRDGQRRFEDDHVITDAVLNYVDTTRGQRLMSTTFIEVDRATMPTALLAAKIAAYGRLHEYVPQHPDRARRSAASSRPDWQYTYPVFPRLLVILDGKRTPTLASRLASRTEDLYALTRADPRLARLAASLSVGVTTLQQLQQHGPFAPIFTPLLRGTPEKRPPLTNLYLKTQ
ncbi:replication-relaxation family protein [Kitasatospora sp. NBC_00240]|uniref:replication-relaxation family protein n=1 Tax=Kitasatospora sp. NBC_00240 TaxID=2903567 RepID=UPI0022581F66|nr:replication-relaxation family protein [Kitasatospora sp. NBC_00240]MCX5216202.1 replication-relaxation family protein [Kitasatospora sp. NBC_00240]